MRKPATVAAFVTSMLVTTALTTTSYLGIYLFASVRKEIEQIKNAPQADGQDARLNVSTAPRVANKLKDAA